MGGIKMKILGLSCGRKNGNSETMLIEALTEAQKTSGAEIELIRLLNLKIKFCTGCISCMKKMLKGGDGKCILKNDHMPFLVEKLGEAEGLILAAPAYHLMPPGLLLTIMNRTLGVGIEYREKCAKRNRVGGAITIGGTDWTNLVLPLTKYALLELGTCNLKLVDQMLVNFVTSPGQVVLREDAIKRAGELGRRVGEALKMPIGDVKYLGEEEETCAICHTNLLEVREKHVVCPICEIKGNIALKGNRHEVVFSEEELKKHRFGDWGHKDHIENIIKSFKEFKERKDEIKEGQKKYKEFKGIISPPPITEES
jgi:multimeric flavodoxin WrbA